MSQHYYETESPPCVASLLDDVSLLVALTGVVTGTLSEWYAVTLVILNIAWSTDTLGSADLCLDLGTGGGGEVGRVHVGAGETGAVVTGGQDSVV